MTAQAAVSKTNVSHQDMANAIRALAMDAVEAAQSGHPGMPMGMADVATVLFTQFLKYDPAHPAWPDRDRFILSAGHGSMLLYAMLYLTGYGDITLEDIKNFRQWGAKTAGHPEFGHAAGIETTTGPLGQGIANAVGMAIAEAHLAARFGKELVDHHTYVIAGDGCLMEGISQEAISLAGHLKLNKLIVLFDDNGISIDGPTSLSITEDTLKRFDASGWKTMRINGHDPFAITTALSQAKASDKPTLIACKTTIAYGAPTKAGSEKSHGSPLGAGEIEGTRKNLNWPHKAFEIPEEVLHAWRDIGHLHDKDYAAWKKRFDKYEQEHQDEYTHALSGDLPKGWEKAVAELKAKIAVEKPSKATRNASQDVLEVLSPIMTELVGGSADLTGSNNTRAKGQEPLTAQNYAGRYIYYGIREHGMAAAMNGMALHGGVIPYGGTFLVFTDYCRPSIRLSALMKQRVIYVMTHDSIGLGEDGPTHQPVEHLASLRAIPNLLVFRPADAMETAECWELAISTPDAPSILALSRQALPTLRQEATKENLCAKGGYLLVENKKAKVTLIATGSEVSLAVEAAKQLETKGIPTSVVSLPCWELFDAQTPEYRTKVLGKDTVKIAIEAAIGFGWEKYTGAGGVFIGMEGFGASAPAKELYKRFGITAERVVEEAMKKLGVLL